MDVSRPSTAVFPSVESDVLRVLSTNTRGMTGREVASLTGRSSHSGVLDVLHRLSDHGLVHRVELNRSYLFSLNREHLAASAVLELVGMRERLIAGMRDEIDRWSVAPWHACLFGSTARRDGDTSSDIDLFVVRPRPTDSDDGAWSEQIDALRTKVEGWTGNRLSVHELSQDDVARLTRERPPIVQELRSDAITLAGPDADDLLG